MSITPEVNDIDISKLFCWKKKVEINGVSEKPITVYMRLIGDADLNRARVASLRASAELRKKFKDENSDEYLAYIPEMDNIEKENITELIIMLNMSEYRGAVENKVKVPFPKEPSANASLESKEKYQEKVDNYPTVKFNKIKEELQKFVDKERIALNKKNKEELMNLYKNLLVNQLCESKMNTAFIGYSIYFGTYLDDELTQRFFNSYESFENLPGYAKEQFIEEYINIQLGMSDLKK
jgi:hypothetical protein